MANTQFYGIIISYLFILCNSANENTFLFLSRDMYFKTYQLDIGEASSAIDCASKCMKLDSCEAVSYNEVSKQCTTLDICPSSQCGDFDLSVGSITYCKKGKMLGQINSV